MDITPEVVSRIIHEFPACIECAEDHLSKTPTYFHSGTCQRGAGLPPEQLAQRIQERVERLPPSESLFCFCGAPATGTGWVAYHNMAGCVEAGPMCDQHSDFEDADNRPHGFIPGYVTKDPELAWERIAPAFRLL